MAPLVEDAQVAGRLHNGALSNSWGRDKPLGLATSLWRVAPGLPATGPDHCLFLLKL